MKLFKSIVTVMGLSSLTSVALAAQPPVYFGKVRNDVGMLYSVQNGSASYVEQRGWDSCPSGYRSIGKVFSSNGFWLCIPNNATGRYWVGNVVNDAGYYYNFTTGYSPTYEGTAFWDTCRSGSLIGHQFESNGFWVCRE